MIQDSQTWQNLTSQENLFQDENDLHILNKAFSLPEMNYFDIEHKQQMITALERWPLLSEIIQQHK